MLKLHGAALAAGLAMAACHLPADAGSGASYLDQMSGGAGVCAAALPAFETQVRKRPLALQNEGTAAVFVTCLPPQLVSGSGDPDVRLQLQILNTGSTEVTVTCTGVGDFGGSLTPSYEPVTVTVAPGGNSTVNWFSTEESNPVTVAASCMLPPGAGIGRVFTFGRQFLQAP